MRIFSYQPPAFKYTVLEQRVNDDIGALYLRVDEFAYGIHLHLLLGGLHQKGIVAGKSCRVRRKYLIDLDYLVHRVAAASLIIERLERL